MSAGAEKFTEFSITRRIGALRRRMRHLHRLAKDGSWAAVAPAEYWGLERELRELYAKRAGERVKKETERRLKDERDGTI